MMFSETYKKYTWEFVVENYRMNLQRCSPKYFNILAKYGKMFLGADGSVLLDASNAQESMKTFMLYTCEIMAYLNAISFLVLDTDNNNLLYMNGFSLLNEDMKKYEDMLSEASFDVNDDQFKLRVHEYLSYKSNKGNLGFSLPGNMSYDTEREQLAAMFADHIASKDVVLDFISYQQMGEACKAYSTSQFVSDIYMFGLDIYDTVKKQSAPYVTGSIIDDRKSKGLCEDCGGTYKGLFKKKCSKCGAAKRI